MADHDRVVTVPPDLSVLDVLHDAGTPVLSSFGCVSRSRTDRLVLDV